VIVAAGAGQSRNVLIRTDTDSDGLVSDNPTFDQLPPPYGASFTSGARVAAGDTDHSGTFNEVITAPGADAGTRNVRVYDDTGDPGTLLSDNGLDDSFVAFPGNGPAGAFVAFARTTEATYTDADTPLVIPDNGSANDPLQAEIRVPRSAGIVRDLDVFLGISHTFDQDLDVSLQHVGPGPTVNVTLFDDVGNNDDGIFVWLDDGASSGSIASVPDDPNDRAVTGSYATEPSFLAFYNGLDASGRWTLTIDDDSASNTGTLQQWSLRINY
jgi:subtilisin-like proprotein convertase family protein